jgi:hypothetical protein
MDKLILPMLAFSLNGYGEYIRITIDEVFGYPDETSHDGGYGARGRIEISSGGYKVDSQLYFTTGELYLFKESLNNCYKNFSGIAKLNNSEHELELSAQFSKTGKVQINGFFQERPDLDNSLKFEFNSDQTCIYEVIKELESVQSIFGAMKGVN